MVNQAGSYKSTLQLVPSQDGWYNIKNDSSNNVLGVMNSAAGTQIVSQIRDNTTWPKKDGQQWKLFVDNFGNYQVINKLAGKFSQKLLTAVTKNTLTMEGTYIIISPFKKT